MLPQELADLCDARVILHLEHGAVNLVAALKFLQPVVRILIHTAELIHRELMHPPVAMCTADALLAIQRISRTLQTDCSADKHARHEPNSYHNARKNYIEDSPRDTIQPLTPIRVAQVLHRLISIVRSNFRHILGPFMRNRNCIARQRVNTIIAIARIDTGSFCDSHYVVFNSP